MNARKSLVKPHGIVDQSREWRKSESKPGTNGALQEERKFSRCSTMVRRGRNEGSWRGRGDEERSGEGGGGGWNSQLRERRRRNEVEKDKLAKKRAREGERGRNRAISTDGGLSRINWKSSISPRLEAARSTRSPQLSLWFKVAIDQRTFPRGRLRKPETSSVRVRRGIRFLSASSCRFGLLSFSPPGNRAPFQKFPTNSDD